MEFKKGDIVLLNLNPTKGSEQQGIRPCVIIQTNTYNKYSSTLVIVPLSSKLRRTDLPTHILITKDEFNKLQSDSIVLIEQIRVIDKSRVEKKIGILNYDMMRDIDDGLKFLLDLD